MLAYTSLSGPDTTVPAEIKPEVSLGFGGYPDSKAIDLFSSSSGAPVLSSSNTPNTFTLSSAPSPPYAFEVDSNVRQRLKGIPAMEPFKYCIFWLTPPSKSSLWTVPNCRVLGEKTDSWYDFRTAFADSLPGFAVYYQSSDQIVYSFMNIVSPCRHDPLGGFLKCPDQEYLVAFKPNWVKLLRGIFKHSKVRSVDNVDYDLPASIGDVKCS
ncbi:hypothetical protein MMC07_009588 [Pseudocyphellaria aurata]|nr:hypothetical protein [Pseudocyphellaria aurata]